MTKLKAGAVRSDGYTFRGYAGGYECWLSPAAHHNTCVGRTFRHAKARANKKFLPFDITVDYLRSIYPDDGRCPALGVPMVWGIGVNDDSPSLDRKVPELGYVRGNVAFISNKANRIKSDATTEEIFAVAKYLKG